MPEYLGIGGGTSSNSTTHTTGGFDNEIEIVKDELDPDTGLQTIEFSTGNITGKIPKESKTGPIIALVAVGAILWFMSKG